MSTNSQITLHINLIVFKKQIILTQFCVLDYLIINKSNLQIGSTKTCIMYDIMIKIVFIFVSI